VSGDLENLLSQVPSWFCPGLAFRAQFQSRFLTWGLIQVVLSRSTGAFKRTTIVMSLISCPGVKKRKTPRFHTWELSDTNCYVWVGVAVLLLVLWKPIWYLNFPTCGRGLLNWVPLSHFQTHFLLLAGSFSPRTVVETRNIATGEHHPREGSSSSPFSS